MSTSPVSTDTPVSTGSHTSAHYTSENYTLLVGYTKEDLDKAKSDKEFTLKLKAYPEGQFTEEEQDETSPNFKFQVAFSQTFVHYSPVDLDGVGELIPDDDEVLNLITAQLKVKLVNRSRSQATSKDFKPVDGVIDMFDECNKKSERRLSQFEKTTQTILKDFTPEMQARLLELLKAQQSA